jgi:hypothetical protein
LDNNVFEFEFEFDCRLILAVIGVTVVICTLWEAVLVFYNNNFAPPSSRTASIEDTDKGYLHVEPITKVYENPAYEHDTKDTDGKLVSVCGGRGGGMAGVCV